MSDEPHLRIAVREYVDREVARALRETEQHFATVEEARRIAENTVNTRLGEMNEFREENRSLTATFVRRDYYDVQHERLVQDVDKLGDTVARASGAVGFGKFGLERLMAFVAVAIALYAVLRP